MRIKCHCPQKEDISLEYSVENNMFYVSASFEKQENCEAPRLTAQFRVSDNSKEFELGTFTENQDIFSIDKSYSLSYLKENSFCPDNLMHFTIYCSDNCKYTILNENKPATPEDESLTRAKATLEGIKPKDAGAENISFLLSSINKNLRKYSKADLPFMPEFSWYKISNSKECFNLSSVNHLKQSEYFNNEKTWYFGRSGDERICAFATDGKKGCINPLSNADDCTVSYVSSSSDKAYYVVGILLLDDGQYFCRLD